MKNHMIVESYFFFTVSVDKLFKSNIILKA